MRYLIVVFMLVCLGGCGNEREDIIIKQSTWDGEPAVYICSPDGNMSASFKMKDLKKLEAFLYDNELDYTDEYKNWKGWLHKYKGRRVKVKK